MKVILRKSKKHILKHLHICLTREQIGLIDIYYLTLFNHAFTDLILSKQNFVML